MMKRSMNRPARGGHHQQADGQGQQGGKVPRLPQLPEQIGQEHPDGALGEVENAGRAVGHHEAGGRNGIHRPRDDARDQQAEELTHRRLNA